MWYERINWVGVSLLLCFLISAAFEHGNAFMVLGWIVGSIGSLIESVLWHNSICRKKD